MTKAFLDYNPVGQSLFILEEEGKEPHEMTMDMSSGNALVEAVCGVLADAGVEVLYCSKTAMGLAPAIKQYVLTEYNNKTLDIQQYD